MSSVPVPGQYLSGWQIGFGTVARWCAIGIALAVTAIGAVSPSPSGVSSTGTVAAEHSLPLRFVPNEGQADPHVRFLGQSPGIGVYFTSSGMTLALARKGRETALQLGFVGANPNPAIVARRRSAQLVSHFRRGNDGTARSHAFEEIVYRDVWPGIDFLVKTGRGALEYELNLAPGARPSDIQLVYRGAEGLSLNRSGGLDVHTGHGVLGDSKPHAFTPIGGRRAPVPSAFELRGQNAYGFSVGRHDPSKPLVIDPELAYSTYLGGSGGQINDEEEAIDVAVDAGGNAYVVGKTPSADFPTTPGAFDTSLAGPSDAFVTKLNADGSDLVYSTFLGGAAGSHNGSSDLENADFGTAVAVDQNGSAVVAGFTRASDFPITAGAFDATFNGVDDAFVAKLSPDGSRLEFSTFLGGDGFDIPYGIVLDGSGHVFVGGTTDSSNYPTTPGAWDRVANDSGYGGFEDAFVTKLAADGSSLVYSTYVGGEEIDEARGIAIDGDGSAYLTGHTYSKAFPTTAGSFDRGPPQSWDAFVTKLNPQGSGLEYSTYLGGRKQGEYGSDYGEGIAVDSDGAAYVTGSTSSSDFPTTPGAVDTTNDNADAFVTKLDPNGSSLAYSTLLGGTGYYEAGLSILVDSSKNAFVSGATEASDFPTTQDAYDRTYNGGFDDAFLARFGPAGELSYSTYLGGRIGFYAFDRPYGMARDQAGAIYLAGLTESSDFPTTEGAYDRSFGGDSYGSDAFVAKFGFPPMASTPGCKVAGAGRITAANGDTADFHGSAHVGTLGARGSQFYVDRGPSQPFNLLTSRITALVCSSGGETATIYGNATISGAETSFRIDATDAGASGRTDSYRLRLGNGYDSGEKRLERGNIQIRSG